MKFIYYRSLKKRRKFAECEIINRLIKVVCVNENLNFSDRQKIFDINNRRLSRSSYSRIKKSCIVTNRSRSINKYFRINRVSLRDLLTSGSLYGFRRSNW